MSDELVNTEAESAPAPKKRGRPRKNPEAAPKAETPAAPAAKTEAPKPVRTPVAETAKPVRTPVAEAPKQDNSPKAAKQDQPVKTEAKSEKKAEPSKDSNDSAKPNDTKSDNSDGDNNHKHPRNKHHKNKRHNNNHKHKKKTNRYNMPDEEIQIGSEITEGGMDIQDMQKLSMAELTEIAIENNVEGVGALAKQELVFAILRSIAKEKGILYSGGVLEILSDGFGFLRSPEYNYQPSPEDIYLSPSQIKRFSLRTGDTVIGQTRPPKEKERFFAMLKVDAINDAPPLERKKKIPFENLTPDFPDRRIVMERTDTKNISMRILDLVTPIGFGQRGVIVAPPRTGKTVLMQDIANSISENHPEAYLILLLIDERPEEVTDMKRCVKGEVVSSTFDEPQARHIQVAEMVIEKAKRMVEHGKDVIILLDSLTRLARAYNATAPHSGKILSGGVDANALHKPKRFFGAARNVQEGGSLTILATALVDTGSKMDEVIFEEFKGTGNMEVHLDRSLVDKRTFPAINIAKSGTRKEELLLHPDEKDRMWKLRRAMTGAQSHESMQLLISGVKKTRTNAEFLMTMQV